MVTPHCEIIYTLPIALYYSLTFKQIANTFSRPYFLRNIHVQERANDPSYALLGQFLEKRLDLSLIEADARHAAIHASGGVVRELVRISKDVTIKALARQRSSIARDLVDAAVIELHNEYSRGLLTRHFEVLYHARVSLEYENDMGERWSTVNPVVQPVLHKNPLSKP